MIIHEFSNYLQPLPTYSIKVPWIGCTDWPTRPFLPVKQVRDRLVCGTCLKEGADSPPSSACLTGLALFGFKLKEKGQGRIKLFISSPKLITPTINTLATKLVHPLEREYLSRPGSFLWQVNLVAFLARSLQVRTTRSDRFRCLSELSQPECIISL